MKTSWCSSLLHYAAVVDASHKIHTQFLTWCRTLATTSLFVLFKILLPRQHNRVCLKLFALMAN